MCHLRYTVSTEIATPHKSIKSRNSNSSAHIQIKPKCDFVLRETQKSERFDVVDRGDVWGGYD